MKRNDTVSMMLFLTDSLLFVIKTIMVTMFIIFVTHVLHERYDPVSPKKLWAQTRVYGSNRSHIDD